MQRRWCDCRLPLITAALQINRSVRELHCVGPLQSYEAITKVIFHKLYFITRKQAFYRDSLTFIRYLAKVPPPGILHNTILHNTHHSMYNNKLNFSSYLSESPFSSEPFQPKGFFFVDFLCERSVLLCRTN